MKSETETPALAPGSAAPAIVPLRPIAALAILGTGAAAVAAGWRALAAASAAIAVVVLADRPILLVYALILFQPLEPLTRPGSLFIRSVDELMIAAVLVLVLLLDLHRRGLQRLLRHFLLVPLLLFVGIAVLSAAVNGASVPLSAAGVGVLVDYVLLAVLIGCARISPDELRGACRLLLIVGIVVCAATLVEAVLGNPGGDPRRVVRTPWLTLVRHSGPFEHPNDLANFIVFPLSLAIAVHVCAGYRSAASRASLWLFLLVFVLAMGRVAWLSLLTAFLAFALLHQRQRVRAVLLSALVVLAVFSPVLYHGLAARIGRTIAQGDARIQFMRQAAPIVRRHPWLGVGPGRFGGTIADSSGSDVETAPALSLRRRGAQLRTVDSFWLALLVETGLLGVAAYTALLGAVLLRSHRVLRRAAPGDSVRPLAAALFMLTIYELLYNVSAPALEDNSLSALYWLMTGLLAAATRDEGRPPPHPQRQTVAGPEVTAGAW